MPDHIEALVATLVERIVKESGSVTTSFKADEWVARWLREPLSALGGKPPIDLLDTPDGREVVIGLIAKMQSGAYV